MGCLIALVALASPRFALVLVWVFTDRISIAFTNNLLPFAGLLFLPWTTLIYTFAYAPIGGVSPLGWACVAFGFFADIASYGSGEYRRRERYGAVGRPSSMY